MMPVPGSNPRWNGLSLIVAASPLIIILAIFASALLLNTWSVQGGTNGPPSVMIDVDHGGHCQLITPSCSDFSTAPNAWSVDDVSITIIPAMALHAVDSIDSVPTEAVVVPPSPPPRPA